ncbi:hypothetical protein [Sphingomonas adhaesiva]|uniref:hypothetical protein n=1 Tax=Sphingomonas adhaesiva TaxID=28212 RepID=UPI002FF54D89
MALCYLDRTFCTADCATPDCAIRLTPEVHAAAARWWAPTMSVRPAPISCADLSRRCPDYHPAGLGSRPVATPRPITSTPAAVTAGALPRKPETRRD